MGSHAEDGSGAAVRSVTELRTAFKALGNQRTGEVTSQILLKLFIYKILYGLIRMLLNFCTDQIHPLIGYIGIRCQNGTLEVIADDQGLTCFVEVVQKAGYTGMVVLTLIIAGNRISGNPCFRTILCNDLCELGTIIILIVSRLAIRIAKMQITVCTAGYIDYDVRIVPCFLFTLVADNGTGLFQLRNISVLNVGTFHKLCPFFFGQIKIDGFCCIIVTGVCKYSNITLNSK